MIQGSIFFNERPKLGSTWKVPEPSDLPYLTGVDKVALDTENTGLNPFEDKVVGIALSWRSPENLDLKSLYCPIAHSEGNMDPSLVHRWLSHVLREKEVVFCNGKYDIQILRQGFSLDLEALGVKPSDVAFKDALVDDNRRAGRKLGQLGERYIGRGKEEFSGDINRMKDYPSWMAAPYAMGDSSLTLEIDEVTEPLIMQDGLDKVRNLENSIIYPVCEIERNGCRLNVELLEQYQQEVKATYENVLMEIFRLTGMMIQIGSGESLHKLFNYLNIAPPPEVEKKKKGQTQAEFAKEDKSKSKQKYRPYSEDELQALKHPVIDKVVDARRLDSLRAKLDKYHEGLHGDIIRAAFHQLHSDEGGTVRGRFSSSGGGDPRSGYGFNAQQVMKTKLQIETGQENWIIRKLFIPDENRMYWSADASQIEYRLAAEMSNAKNIIKAYQENPETDFHGLLQSHIVKYKPTFDNRTITKNVSFAYVFGAGDEQLAITAGITLQEARELKGICKGIFPEAPPYLKSLASQAEIRGCVSTLYGRRARFGPKDRFYAALNAVIQGSAADIFKVTLKAIYDNRHTLGITKLRQIIHDEFNGDVLPGEVYINRMREFFNEQRVPLKIPILWDLKVGRCWADCK